MFSGFRQVSSLFRLPKFPREASSACAPFLSFATKPTFLLVLFASLAEHLCPFVLHLGDFEKGDPQQLGYCMESHEAFPIGFETYTLFSLCCFLRTFNRKEKMFEDLIQSFLCYFYSPSKLYFHPAVLHIHLTYPDIQAKMWESRSV